MTCAAKCCQPRMPEFEFPCPVKEAGVFDIRAGPATFDVVYAQLVQLSRYEQLVFDRECDALTLCSVSQRRIVYLYPRSHCLPLKSVVAGAMWVSRASRSCCGHRQSLRCMTIAGYG